MHELGIVFNIAKRVEKVAEENAVEHVHSVTLEIGEVSTVIPEYLVDVWNWNCKKTPILDGCKLKWERIKAITHCEDCETNYDTVPNGKECPNCGSNNTFLVTGNEINIKEIMVE